MQQQQKKIKIFLAVKLTSTPNYISKKKKEKHRKTPPRNKPEMRPVDDSWAWFRLSTRRSCYAYHANLDT